MSIIKKYIKISLMCVPIGIIVGTFCFVFTYGLNAVNAIRVAHPYITIPFLFLAGIIIVWLYEKCDDKEVSVKSGMKLVFECGKGKGDRVPLVLIPLVCIATWLTNLCGGSCGREGVAVQIGATTSKYFSKWMDHKRSGEIFLIAGIGAGFAAMFQTPLAGIVFAMEVITIGEYKLFAFVPTIVESLAAYLTAHMLHMNIETYDVANIDIVDSIGANVFKNIDYILIIKVIAASIIFGLCGLIFSTLLEKLKEVYNIKVKNKYIGIALSGIILSILFLALGSGRYSGTGTNLIIKCFTDGHISSYDFALKAVLTILTLAVGYQGGEVTPLFTIGATLGFILGKGMGIDTGFLASLGFISVFASATNTLLSPIMLGIEIFGLPNAPFYVISVGIAYLLNFNRSIYHQGK